MDDETPQNLEDVIERVELQTGQIRALEEIVTDLLLELHNRSESFEVGQVLKYSQEANRALSECSDDPIQRAYAKTYEKIGGVVKSHGVEYCPVLKLDIDRTV